MLLTPIAAVNVLTVIEAPATRRLVSGLLREIGLTDITETENIDHAILQLRHASTKFGLIICDRIGGIGHLALLRFIRWDQTALPTSLPVICVSSQWTANELIAARDSGASLTLSMPITKRALEMAVASATSGQRPFVTSSAYRGVDRRVATVSGYAGPFRREDDARYRRAPGSPVIAEAEISAQPAVGKETAKPHGGSPTEEEEGERQADFNWFAAIATGHEGIDSEHQNIFDILRHLKECGHNPENDDSVTATLEGLKDYVKTHFAHEERLMDEFDYDERDRHKKEHASFTKKVNGLSHAALKDRKRSLKFLFFIYDWLVTHIGDIDRVMIAKMNGEFDDAFNNDPYKQQTGSVINDAHVVAAQVHRLATMLKDAPTPSRRASLSQQIADATE
ncbi:MAG: bacteriohemerythrin, partial [Alphaproteobacteria bacterium]|nr:bacteriohemerythrin [Alphaproteobacteria bacterium]